MKKEFDFSKGKKNPYIHCLKKQLITLALAEKIAALDAEDYLNERARRGKRSKFLDILKNAPNVKPNDKDKRQRQTTKTNCNMVYVILCYMHIVLGV